MTDREFMGSGAKNPSARPLDCLVVPSGTELLAMTENRKLPHCFHRSVVEAE